MRSLTTLPFLLAVACGTGPTSPSAQQTGKNEIALRYGQSVVVPGTVLEIGFQALLGDSRCPLDVVCVWQGEGRVELGVAMGDGPTVPIELSTHHPRSATYGPYTISLVALDPYPESTRPKDPADYIVRLLVSARGTQPE